MTKVELSKSLGLSLTTISRYCSMGLPHERVGNKYDFDLDEVSLWRRQNILPTYRINNPPEKVPTAQEIASWALNFSLALLNFMQKMLQILSSKMAS